ncbi:FUSC family protein [Macrococcus carouselicus]|uniref:Aromatic acid exporter family protein n=1 Tax=Macrococcus carouselicus TaxID=69969 RepID=A0A9Q8FQD0_9STAP|nr:aromatic acid exporter family protein [Macrococcus carouselicus]TDM00742.1 aromatic acid exporter family protein [Macrococcus carouselicus]
MNFKHILGPRIIKTGLATFLTALFCQLLTLPSTFAVITAIVSIEPTAKASLRKAYIRFPASILGAFIAVTATYFLGDSPLAYSIAATLTIVVCYQLKLFDGMLVASLTAVAMVPNIHDAFAYNFFSRLATTTIGLTTAGLVNYLVLPAKYQHQIQELIRNIENDTHDLFILRSKEVLIGNFQSTASTRKIETINTKVSKAHQLIKYEHEEYQYHKDLSRKRTMTELEKRLQIDQLIILHLSNMIYLPENQYFDFTLNEREAYVAILEAMERKNTVPRPALSTFKTSVKHLNEFDDNQLKSHYIYELLMIQKLLKDHPA